MVSGVFASSAVDREFEPRLSQTKDRKISICCFSGKRAALRSKIKDLLGRHHIDEVDIYLGKQQNSIMCAISRPQKNCLCDCSLYKWHIFYIFIFTSVIRFDSTCFVLIIFFHKCLGHRCSRRDMLILFCWLVCDDQRWKFNLCQHSYACIMWVFFKTC
jgi:hypothetical protein